MIYIISNPDGTIKTYMQNASDIVLVPGENIVISPLSMDQYAARFVLSHQGQSCCTVTAHVGDPAILIDISVPGCESASVDVNGEEKVINLLDGKGVIELGTTKAGTFLLSPTNRKQFCSAGNGQLTVEIAV
jgi:hypothetical protein